MHEYEQSGTKFNTSINTVEVELKDFCHQQRQFTISIKHTYELPSNEGFLNSTGIVSKDFHKDFW